MMENYRQRAAALWLEARDAVNVFIAELAVHNVLAQPPDALLRIGPSSVDVLRREGPRMEPILTAPGRPQEAVKIALEKLGASLGKDCALELDAGLRKARTSSRPSSATRLKASHPGRSPNHFTASALKPCPEMPRMSPSMLA
jgi:hypothetical protein